MANEYEADDEKGIISSTVFGWVLPWLVLTSVLAVQIYFWAPSISSTKSQPPSVRRLEGNNSSVVQSTTLDETLQQWTTRTTPTITRDDDDKIIMIASKSDPLSDIKSAANVTIKLERSTINKTNATSGDDTTTGKSTRMDNSDTNNTRIITPTNTNAATNNDTTNSNNWRCVCETGFLPPGMLKSLGGSAESVFKLGTGQCYHKQA
jgi:hypothetical protein